MSDLTDLLASLRRPRLLIRAARFGLAEYNRERDLRRLMRVSTAPSPARAVAGLIDEEARLEANRQAGEAAYSPGHNVDVLIALMAEAKLLARPARDV